MADRGEEGPEDQREVQWFGHLISTYQLEAWYGSMFILQEKKDQMYGAASSL